MLFAKKLIGLINHGHHRATQEVARYGKKWYEKFTFTCYERNFHCKNFSIRLMLALIMINLTVRLAKKVFYFI